MTDDRFDNFINTCYLKLCDCQEDKMRQINSECDNSEAKLDRL